MSKTPFLKSLRKPALLAIIFLSLFFFSAVKIDFASAANACGTAISGTFPTMPKQNLCSVGQPALSYNSGKIYGAWRWRCCDMFIIPYNCVPCQANITGMPPQPTPTPISLKPVCGSIHNKQYDSGVPDNSNNKMCAPGNPGILQVCTGTWTGWKKGKGPYDSYCINYDPNNSDGYFKKIAEAKSNGWNLYWRWGCSSGKLTSADCLAEFNPNKITSFCSEDKKCLPYGDQFNVNYCDPSDSNACKVSKCGSNKDKTLSSYADIKNNNFCETGDSAVKNIKISSGNKTALYTGTGGLYGMDFYGWFNTVKSKVGETGLTLSWTCGGSAASAPCSATFKPVYVCDGATCRVAKSDEEASDKSKVKCYGYNSVCQSVVGCGLVYQKYIPTNENHNPVNLNTQWCATSKGYNLLAGPDYGEVDDPAVGFKRLGWTWSCKEGTVFTNKVDCYAFEFYKGDCNPYYTNLNSSFATAPPDAGQKLCAKGIPSIVDGADPYNWKWICRGQGEGTEPVANCVANKKAYFCENMKCVEGAAGKAQGKRLCNAPGKDTECYDAVCTQNSDGSGKCERLELKPVDKKGAGNFLYCSGSFDNNGGWNGNDSKCNYGACVGPNVTQCQLRFGDPARKQCTPNLNNPGEINKDCLTDEAYCGINADGQGDDKNGFMCNYGAKRNANGTIKSYQNWLPCKEISRNNESSDCVAFGCYGVECKKMSGDKVGNGDGQYASCKNADGKPDSSKCYHTECATDGLNNWTGQCEKVAGADSCSDKGIDGKPVFGDIQWLKHNCGGCRLENNNNGSNPQCTRHLGCNASGQCVYFSGAGIDSCSNPNQCKHLACSSQGADNKYTSCGWVPGQGMYECTLHEDAQMGATKGCQQPAYYCKGNKCETLQLGSIPGWYQKYGVDGIDWGPVPGIPCGNSNSLGTPSTGPDDAKCAYTKSYCFGQLCVTDKTKPQGAVDCSKNGDADCQQVSYCAGKGFCIYAKKSELPADYVSCNPASAVADCAKENFCVKSNGSSSCEEDYTKKHANEKGCADTESCEKVKTKPECASFNPARSFPLESVLCKNGESKDFSSDAVKAVEKWKCVLGDESVNCSRKIIVDGECGISGTVIKGAEILSNKENFCKKGHLTWLNWIMLKIKLFLEGKHEFNCLGENGGELKKCSVTVSLVVTEAKCGDAHGKTYKYENIKDLDANNLNSIKKLNIPEKFCSDGAGLKDNSFSENNGLITGYKWTCFAANSVPCSITLEYNGKLVNGVCGKNINNKEYTDKNALNKDSAGLCESGNVSDFKPIINSNGTGQWKWTCSGIGAGTESPSCYAWLVLPKNKGQCGSAATKLNYTASQPYSNLCVPDISATKAGLKWMSVSSGDHQPGYWWWQCPGLNGGESVPCTSYKAKCDNNAQCGTPYLSCHNNGTKENPQYAVLLNTPTCNTAIGDCKNVDFTTIKSQCQSGQQCSCVGVDINNSSKCCVSVSVPKITTTVRRSAISGLVLPAGDQYTQYTYINGISVPVKTKDSPVKQNISGNFEIAVTNLGLDYPVTIGYCSGKAVTIDACKLEGKWKTLQQSFSQGPSIFSTNVISKGDDTLLVDAVYGCGSDSACGSSTCSSANTRSYSKCSNPNTTYSSCVKATENCPNGCSSGSCKSSPTPTPITGVSISASAPKTSDGYPMPGSVLTANISPSGATANYSWSYYSSDTILQSGSSNKYTVKSSDIPQGATQQNIKVTVTGTGNYSDTKDDYVTVKTGATVGVPVISFAATVPNAAILNTVTAKGGQAKAITINSGDHVELSWNVTGGGSSGKLNYIYASGGGDSGSSTVIFPTDKDDIGTFSHNVTYTLVATNSAGTTTATINIVVNPVLTSIAISPASSSITSGGSTSFTVTAKDQFGNSFAGAAIDYTSNNASVTISPLQGLTSNSGTATVTATGVSAGTATATVTATAHGTTKSASATVNVNPAPASTINITPKEITLNPKTTQKFTATAFDSKGNPLSNITTFTWSSSSVNATVDITSGPSTNATVSSNAPTGSPNNEIIITAKSGTVSGMATITVTATPSVTVSGGTSVVVGKTLQLTAIDQGAYDITSTATWSSSNTDIATVSGGTVTGKAAGQVTITVTKGNVSDAINVTVTPVYTLTVNVTNGTVAKNPSPDQGGKYNSGTTVTLTATPNSGYSFSNWSGDDIDDSNKLDNPVTIIMDSNKVVTANFSSKITPTLSVTNSPVIYNGSQQLATVVGSVQGNVSSIKYDGSLTKPTNAGTYAVTADFVPTDTTHYNSLTQALAGNFKIEKADQATLTLSAGSTTLTVGSTTNLSATGGSTNGTVTYSVTTNNPIVAGQTVCSITGTTLTASAQGTCTVSATMAGNSNYNPKTSVAVTITVTSAPNPVPTITSISPASKTAGDSTFALTVNGTNFISSSVVKLDGSSRTITSASSTQLTVTILTSDLTAAGTHSITVFNPTPGGGNSNAQTLTVASSSNATLSNLVVSQGTLSPAFSSSTISYTDSVANSVSSITVTPTVTQPGATIKVNNTTVASGYASGSISLAVGSNPITVVVTAPSGATKTYTVTVTRASANPTTVTLTVSISPCSVLSVLAGNVQIVDASNNNALLGTAQCATKSVFTITSGHTLKLTANSGSGYTFSGWGGTNVGDLFDKTGNTAKITMNGNKSVTANFTQISNGLQVSPATALVPLGMTQLFNATGSFLPGSVNWSSSANGTVDPLVGDQTTATVSQNAKLFSTITITATAGGLTGKATITVQQNCPMFPCVCYYLYNGAPVAGYMGANPICQLNNGMVCSADSCATWDANFNSGTGAFKCTTCQSVSSCDIGSCYNGYQTSNLGCSSGKILCLNDYQLWCCESSGTNCSGCGNGYYPINGGCPNGGIYCHSGGSPWCCIGGGIGQSQRSNQSALAAVYNSVVNLLKDINNFLLGK